MNQTAILCNLTGEQKMEQAFLLSDFVLELSKLNIKKILGKNASKKNIIKELRKRMR